MNIIVISSAEAVENEAAIINALFSSGLTLLHLRKPGLDLMQMRCLLNHIESDYHPYISLHQHHQLIDEYNTRRLHYSELTRLKTDTSIFEEQRRRGIILSTSIHTIGDLLLLNLFDYAFFGPVFDSLSKPGYTSKLNKSFSLTKGGVNVRVIALGGIHTQNLETVKHMGFDGAAVLGALWNNPLQAISTFKQLLSTASSLDN